MLSVQSFTFNPFQENTFVLSNERKDCFIIDPGCAERYEKEELLNYLQSNQLNPIRLINTHGHIDHIMGNQFIFDHFNLKPQIHQADLKTLQQAPEYAHLYGINIEPSPEPEVFLKGGENIRLGENKFDLVFVPGHSPGHIALICHDEKVVIGGDVLFEGSIGRTDLPGGDMDTLLKSIKDEFFSLPDDYTVYSGHGNKTTIGKERKSNPFLQGLK